MAERAGNRGWGRSFEWRIRMLACGLLVLSIALAVALWWFVPLDPLARGALLLAVVVVAAILAKKLVDSTVEPLRGLTNVVEAYRGGDYTLRSSRELAGDALGDLVHEINGLGRTLHEQRLRAMEATALLEKLIGAIDVAILAFDGEGRLRLLNDAASQLLSVSASEAVGKAAVELALDEFLAAQSRTQVVTAFAGRTGRWQVTHGVFREGGVAQHLLIVSSVEQVLREEERGAWQRLIRVISHEVNNSLAPIKSLAVTLREMLDEALAAGTLREDVLPALRVIADRTDSLQRFLAQHTRLARLPTPQRRWFTIRPLLDRVAQLEHSPAVEVLAPPDLEVHADEDQLEQALINLVKNAIEALREPGAVRLEALSMQEDLALTVKDDGPGIANPDNLFVPFFTTKPGGSGIGLPLSRQIAEAHGGTLRVENRSDAPGTVATLEIPGAARRRPGG